MPAWSATATRIVGARRSSSRVPAWRAGSGRAPCVARTGGEQEASARLGVLNPVRADQLVVAPAAEAMGYAGGLPFSGHPRARRDLARAGARAAIGDGFTGLSVTGDMRWLTELDVTLGDICDYENRCTGIVEDLPASALCVYDRRDFDDRTLAHAGHAHPICRGRGVGPAGVFVSRMMEIAAAGPGGAAVVRRGRRLERAVADERVARDRRGPGVRCCSTWARSTSSTWLGCGRSSGSRSRSRRAAAS